MGVFFKPLWKVDGWPKHDEMVTRMSAYGDRNVSKDGEKNIGDRGNAKR